LENRKPVHALVGTPGFQMRRSHPRISTLFVVSNNDVLNPARNGCRESTSFVVSEDNSLGSPAADNPPLATRFAKAVSGRRRELGLTQAQLAEALGVDTETLSRFERGKHLPSLKTLEKLASLLVVPMTALLVERAPEVEEDAHRISAWMRGLSAEDRAFLLDLVKRQAEYLSRR
jgi:transcriptional regulator with XRE-family HTH domain